MDLTTLRTSLGLKGAQFARLIGISPGQLHDLENGRRRLTIERAAQIERATGRNGLVDAVVRERTATPSASSPDAAA